METEQLYTSPDLEVFRTLLKTPGNTRPSKVIYSFVFLQTTLKKETTKIAQLFNKKILEKNEPCSIFIDSKSVKLASPSVISEQAQFLQEMAVVSQNNIQRVGFVTSTLSSAILGQILKRSKPNTPYQLFNDSNEAWEYVTA